MSLLIDMFTSSIVTNGPIWHMEKEKSKRWYTWNMYLKYIDLQTHMKSCTRHINCLSSLAAYLDFSLNFKWPMFSIRFCDSRENKQKTQNNTEIFKESKPKCVKLGLKMGLPRDPMCPTFGPIFNWVWVQDRSRDPTKFGVLIHGFMSRYILYTEK